MPTFSEPIEPEDVFSRDEAQEYRRRRDEKIRRNAEISKAATEQEAQRRADADKFSRETSRRAILREYEAAGVEPPTTNDDGTPTCSLSLLLSMGWSVSEFDGKRTLLRPGVER